MKWAEKVAVFQSLDPEEFPDTNQDPNDEIEDLIDELAESMSDSGQEMDPDAVSVISTPKPRLRWGFYLFSLPITDNFMKLHV